MLLDAGEADLTLGVPPSTATGRILQQPLFEERFVCVLRRDHPAAWAGTLDLDAFAALPHLLYSPEGGGPGYVDLALARLGRTRRVALRVPMLHVVPILVARSDMVATLTAGVVTASGQADRLVALEPPLALDPVPFIMACHRRTDAHPGQAWLREAVADLGRPEGLGGLQA